MLAAISWIVVPPFRLTGIKRLLSGNAAIKSSHNVSSSINPGISTTGRFSRLSGKLTS
jgi:hypothetical protein